MSDFLTRLAQRHLGQMNTIEPRVPPIYAETEPAIQGPDPIETVVLESREQPDHGSVSIQAEYRPAAAIIRPFGHYALDAADHRSLDTQPGLAHTLAPAPAPRVTPRPPAKDLEPTEAHEPDRTAARTRPVVPEASAYTSSVKKMVVSDSPVRQRLPSHDATVVASAPVPLQPAIKETPSHHIERLTAPVSLAARKDGPKPRPRPRLEAPIHVVIGRIEVTAQTTSAPTKRTSPGRKAKLSLDQYLAKRHGAQP
jgi:hypothetical protein